MPDITPDVSVSPETNFPLTQGMDHSNLDLLQALTTNQDTTNKDISVGIKPTPVPGSDFNPPSIDGGQGKSFLDNLDAAYQGPKDNPLEQNTQGYSMPKDAMSGRYPQYYKDINNEDLAAQKQSTINRIGSGVAKAVGTAGITFAQGIVAPIYGSVKGIIDGKFSSIYDNDAMKALDAASKSMDKALPNYQTDVQQNTNAGNLSWWVPGGQGLFSNNFLFDKALGTVGFMAGMAGSAMALGGIGGVIGDAMPAFGKVAATGQIAETVEDAEQILNQVNKPNTFSTWASKLKAADVSNFNILDKGQRLVASTFASAGISASMALESKNKFLNDTRQKFIEDNGYAPGAADIQKMNDLSDQAGNSIFGLSTLLSAYSFHGTLGKIMSSFEKNEVKTLADQVVLKQGEKEIANGVPSMGKVGVTTIAEDGTTSVVGAEAPTQYAVKPVEQSWYSQTDFAKSTVGKGLGYAGKAFSVPAAIGMMEFNTLSPGVENYFNKKYKEGDAQVFNDLIVPGVKNIFTGEGLESFILGGLVGKGFEHFGGEEKQKEEFKKAQEQHTQVIVDNLNKTYAETYLKAQVDHFKRGADIAAEKAKLDPNNVIDQQDANFDYLHNYISERVKFGLHDMIKSDMDNYKNLASTPEGLQQLKDDGVIHKDITKEQFTKHLDRIQAIADRTATTFEDLNAKLGNLKGTDDKRLYDDTVIEKMLYAKEKVANYSGRIEKLSKKVIADGTVIDSERNIKEQLPEMLASINKRPITLDEKEKAFRDASDILRLNNRRAQFIEAFDNIKREPFNAKDTVKENLIPTTAIKPTTSPKEIGPTIPIIHGNSKTGEDGKKIPSNIEIGQEYTAGGITSPGEYNGKISPVKEFSKFKVLGEETVNGKKMIKISYDNDTKTTYKDPTVFKNLLLTKTSDLEANPEAKFYVDHANDVFTYRFGKEGEGAVKNGVIGYDKESSGLTFKYRGNDGRVYTKNIGIEDFTKPRNNEDTARLQFKDSKTKISAEEFNRLKDYQDPNKQAKAKRQLELVNRVLDASKSELKDLKDRVQEHEEFLKSVKDNMEKLQERIEKNGVTKKSLKSYSRELSDMQEFHADLQKELNTLTTKRDVFQDYVNSLEDSIGNLQSAPEGTELLEFMKKGAKAIQDKIDNNDTIIGQIKGLMGKAKDYIKKLTSTLIKKIARFESAYPTDVPSGVEIMDATVAKNLYTLLKANENDLNRAEGITYNDSSLWQDPQVGLDTPSNLSEKSQTLKDFLEKNSNYFRDRDEISDNINTLEVRKSEIEQQIKAIKEIQQDTAELRKELNVQNALIDSFQHEYDKWRVEDEAKKAFSNSPIVRKVIKSYGRDASNEQFAPGLNPPQDYEPHTTSEVDVEKKINQANRLSITDKYIGKSVSIADSKYKGTPFYNSHNRWPEREAAFTNNISKNNFVPTIDTKLTPELKGLKITPQDADANIRVVLIHKGNQDTYGFKGLIPDTYEAGAEVINNAGPKRDNARAAIVPVYVYDHEGTFYTMDKEGKLLKQVSEAGDNTQDTNNAVFTYLGTSLLKGTGLVENGESRFYDTAKYTPEELTTREQQGTTERGKILDNNTIYPEKFTMSRGKLNTIPGSINNNSLEDVNIIEHDDLYTPGLLGVATLESPDKKGFSKIGNNYVPLGLSYINTKTGPVPVNTRRMHERDATNIYNLLKKVVSNMFESYTNTTKENFEEDASKRLAFAQSNKEIYEIKKYLRGTMFFIEPREGYKIGRNQVYFNSDGDFVMGGKSIKLTPDNMENPLIRQAFIETMTHFGDEGEKVGIFHNINQSILKNDNGVFTELRTDTDGNIDRIHWKNYQSYLLSPHYDLDEKAYDDTNKAQFEKYNGKDRNSGGENYVPVTTNAIKPSTPGESAIINRYINIDSLGERMTPKAPEAPKVEVKAETAPQKAPEVKLEPKKEELQSDSFKLGTQNFKTDGQFHNYDIAKTEVPLKLTVTDGKVKLEYGADFIKDASEDPTALAKWNTISETLTKEFQKQYDASKPVEKVPEPVQSVPEQKPEVKGPKLSDAAIEWQKSNPDLVHDPNNPTPDHPDFEAFQERKNMNEDGDFSEPPATGNSDDVPWNEEELQAEQDHRNEMQGLTSEVEATLRDDETFKDEVLSTKDLSTKIEDLKKTTGRVRGKVPSTDDVIQKLTDNNEIQTTC